MSEYGDECGTSGFVNEDGDLTDIVDESEGGDLIDVGENGKDRDMSEDADREVSDNGERIEDEERNSESEIQNCETCASFAKGIYYFQYTVVSLLARKETGEAGNF